MLDSSSQTSTLAAKMGCLLNKTQDQSEPSWLCQKLSVGEGERVTSMGGSRVRRCLHLFDL